MWYEEYGITKPFYGDDWVCIIKGDCREELPKITKQVNLVLTSPPYDNLRDYGGHEWGFKTTARGLYKLTREGSVIVWIVGDQVIDGSESGSSFQQALYFKSLGLRLHDTMIYGKNGTSRPDDTRYNQCFEYMFVLSNGKPRVVNQIKQDNMYYSSKTRYFTRRMRNGGTEPSGYKSYTERVIDNVWFYETGYMKSAKDNYIFEHPAIFPEQLAVDHISSWSNVGDTILDPFLGSGTTAYCAKKLNRHCIGIEIEEKYCEIAAKRCSQGVFNLEL